MATATQDVTIWDETNTGSAVQLTGTALPGSLSTVVAGGSDGTNIRAMALDTTGRTKVELATQTLTAVVVSPTTAVNSTANPFFTRLIDASGNSLSLADAAAIGGTQGGILALGRDGSGNAQQISVDTSGRQDVRVSDGSGNGVTSTLNPTGIRGLDAAVRTFVATPTNHIFQTGTLTTTATTANQVVVTYTVPASQTFLLVGWGLNNISGNATDMNPARLRVAGTDIFARATAANPRSWEPAGLGCPGVKIATAAQVITITITPSAAGSTNWSGFVAGYLIDN